MAVLKSVEEMQVAINLAKAHLRKASTQMGVAIEAMKRLPDECHVEHVDVGPVMAQAGNIAGHILAANGSACDLHNEMGDFAKNCYPPLDIHDEGGIIALGGGGR